jgi:ankyrin repeat protein
VRLKDTPGLRFTHMLQGNTCLLNAAVFNNNEAAEVLLAHGADPSIANVSSKSCRPSFVMHVSGTR